MSVPFTRRELAGIVAAAAAVSQDAGAQAPADFEKKALDSVASRSKTLSSTEIPLSTEPAFHFRA